MVYLPVYLKVTGSYCVTVNTSTHKCQCLRFSLVPRNRSLHQCPLRFSRDVYICFFVEISCCFFLPPQYRRNLVVMVHYPPLKLILLKPLLWLLNACFNPLVASAFLAFCFALTFTWLGGNETNYFLQCPPPLPPPFFLLFLPSRKDLAFAVPSASSCSVPTASSRCLHISTRVQLQGKQGSNR